MRRICTRKRRIDASNIRPIIKFRNTRYHKESEQTPAEVRSSDTPTQEPCPGRVLQGYVYRQPEREDIQCHCFTMAVALPEGFIRPSRGQQQNSNLGLYAVRQG